MITIGVFGAGHLGKIHLKLLQAAPQFDVVGLHDPDAAAAQAAAEQFGLTAYDDPAALMSAADAVDIASATLSHYDLAAQAIRQSCHLFVEKPLADTPNKARELVELAKEAGVVGQVGHVERFNPAYLAVRERDMNPMFIETHRLAEWNPRGADVSVIHDLMIHDLDIILKNVRSSIKRVAANGVAVITDSPDIANARIEFHNGCVANLTASRISLKQMRKMRIFREGSYWALDFLDKRAEVFDITSEEPAGGAMATFEMNNQKKYLNPYLPPIIENNAIEDELAAFAEAIESGTEPPVTLYDGYHVLAVAQDILEKIQPVRV